MLANEISSPRHFACDRVPAHMGARLAMPSWGRSVCYAGIACMLAGSLVPAALADGNPSIGWDPEVPSIDPNDPSGGNESGGGEVPETPEPPVVDPEPEVPVEPDPPAADPEPEPEIPDSGTTAPDPDYLYPNGSGSVGGEGAFYDPEYPEESAPAAVEQAPEPEVAATVTVPVFGSYDANTGVLSGSAQPGSTVRVVDAAGNVVGDVAVDENGVFSIALPAGTDLAGLSIYVIDAEGNQVGDVLSGATVVQEIARQELEAVRTATGASTVELAEQLSSTVGRIKTAAFIDEPEGEGMPVLPYAIGAASAVVAVGAVGAGVALYRRRSSQGDDSQLEQGASSVPRGADSGALTARMAAPVAMSGKASGHFSGSTNPNDTFAHMDAISADQISARAVADDLDELEMLAMSLHGQSTTTPVAKTMPGASIPKDEDDPDPEGPGGGPGGGAPADPGSTAAFLAIMGVAPAAPSSNAAQSQQGDGPADRAEDILLPTAFMNRVAFEADPEITLISSPSDEVPLDDESFARLAHILATGSGKIHRVTKSYSDLDLAGLDLLDEEQHTSTSAVVADPLAARDDWQEVALRELTAPSAEPVREYPQLSTEDYVALVSTQRRQGPYTGAESPRASYVAPVVGPSSLSAEEATRHRAILQESTATAAIELRNRDAAFKNRVRSEEPVRQSGIGQGRSPMADVPTIVRGGAGTPGPAQRSMNLSDRMYLEKQSLSVPDPSCFAPVPLAPVSAPIRDRGVAAAVAAAQNVYAAYGNATTTAFVPASPTVLPLQQGQGDSVSSAVAAAYASAVYGSPSSAARQAPAPMEQERYGGYGNGQFLDGTGTIGELAARPLPAIGTEGDFSDPYDSYGVSSGISAAYINYMVQDEFEHRHDTTAQRNAALGRLHIVNGAAHAPVPLAARYRHPA